MRFKCSLCNQFENDVLDNLGGGRQSDVIAGIQWVVQKKDVYGVDIINLSLREVASESWITDPLSQAAQAAWDNGIKVVAAAGNDGPSVVTIRTPGINPNIITVGASDDRGTTNSADDIVATFSSRGPTIDGFAKPDILAPGVDIISIHGGCNLLAQKERCFIRGYQVHEPDSRKTHANYQPVLC